MTALVIAFPVVIAEPYKWIRQNGKSDAIMRK
jgi:hypothetical protein